MTNDIIASTLGIRDLEEAKEEIAENLPVVQHEHLPALSTPSNINQENLKDIELARENVKNIIELGDEAVKEMVEIAKQSESPRAFEVVSTLMKTLLDANKDYVDISTKKKFAQEDTPASKQETNITNNNLILSTADLLKALKGESE